MASKICKTLFIFVVLIKQKTDLAIAIHKYVPQTDLSEHCKRRVVPSVFLGNQVMESSSHVMHFSQLDVPYSCFLSVRAESGYNIILVIQLLSEYSLEEACSKNQDQLIVYELGETFGGYWGPQPIMKPQARNYTQYYTLKTTPAMKTERSSKYKVGTQKPLQQSFPAPTDKEPEYMRMDVPLVNVSGNLQLAGPLRHTYNAEEMFDFIYDVTPRNGVEYETSIMPLVQFSIKPQKNVGFYDGTPRYELDYDIRGFTPDFRFFARLPPSSWNATITSTLIPTLVSKYSTVSWKDMDDIIKYYNLTSTRSTQEYSKYASIRNIIQDISNMDHNFSVYLTPNISTYIKAKGMKDTVNVKLFTKKDMRPILKSSNPIQIFKTTKSLFSTNLEKLDNFYLESPNKTNRDSFKSTAILYKQNNVYKNHSVTITLENQTNVENSSENNEIKKNNDTTTKVPEVSYENVNLEKEIITNGLKNKSAITTTAPIQIGTLVDRESWDNIVQVAPVMAVVLNKTEMFPNNKARLDGEKTNHTRRKKRYIQSLQIENARPRNLTTKRPVTVETEQSFRISDIQDLARLVELQDDEMEGRVALRYLRNYVGSTLLNICDFSEPKIRQTFLFNASRIVIALNNFTLDRMMLVVTPAQTLLDATSRCPSGYLECQAVGTRVCIDDTNSCDNVPNCGSYDIYDEDRLLCGVSKDLQFNIYLAALTFLAVLLTMLYIVHYWLKRCVPKVSEAFFIYTEASENTLFLDSVMRSPTDMDDASCKLVLSGHFFDDDLYEDKEEVESNSCVKFLKKCCGFLFKRKRKDKQSEDVIGDISEPNEPAKMFSFTELELRKYTPKNLKDEAIQAGDNDEELKQIESRSELGPRDRVKESLKRRKSPTYSEEHANELNIIKFAKETRSSSSHSDTFTFDKNDFRMNRRYAIVADDEREIRSTVYDHRSNKSASTSEKIPQTIEVHAEKPKKKEDIKRLRFEEAPTMIPSVDDEDDIAAETTVRRSVILGPSHTSKQNLDTITESEEISGASKDFMRFWGGKGKKGKKKEKQLPPR